MTHGRRGDAGWNSFVGPGREARQRAAAASAAPLSTIDSGAGGPPGAGGSKAAINLSKSSLNGGGEGEGGGWMFPPQRRSQPMATPAAPNRSRESGSGDMAPANSLVGSPTAGSSSGGLLGVMFSGISSLSQRATDLLTQLDHDFETIFNGVLDEEQGTASTGADSDSDPRVGPVDQSHRREKSGSGGGSGGVSGTETGTVARPSALHREGGRLGRNIAPGKDSSGSGTLRALSGGAGMSGAQKKLAGGRTVTAEVASTAGKPPPVGRSSAARSAGGRAAAIAGGHGGSTAAGRSRREDNVRFSSGGGGDLWNEPSDDEDNWGWGARESKTGRIATQAGSSGIAGVALPSPAQQSPAHARALPEAVAATAAASTSPPAGPQSFVVPSTSAVPSSAAPSKSLRRSGGRNVGGEASVGATSAASLTSMSSVRSSRSGARKLFVIRPSATAASANAAADRADTAASGGSLGTGTRPSDSGSTSAFQGAPIGSAASLPKQAAASATTEPHPTTAGSQMSSPQSKQSFAGSPQPQRQVRQTQPTRDDPGSTAAPAAAVATAAATAAQTEAVVAATAVADGVVLVAEAKAAAAAMAAAAESVQRELSKQLDEARRCANAAEARCTELQQQLEAEAAEAARLKSVTELMQTQLEASRLRFEELLTEHTYLRATATATHLHLHHQPHPHHRHQPVAMADAACSPTRAASPAAVSPPAGRASDQMPAGRQGSGDQSRRPSISGGGSDELVEATLVAQLTAALADKARLWRENDILTRQLESLQELLSYTAQQASYAHADGCNGDEEDHYIMGASAHETYDPSDWQFGNAMMTQATAPPPPSVVLETAGGPTAAAGAGFSSSSPISCESLGAYGDLLYNLGDGRSPERCASELSELPSWGVQARAGGDAVGGGSAADGAVFAEGLADEGRRSVARDMSALPAGACSAADVMGPPVAAAATGAATQISLESPGCGPQRPDQPSRGAKQLTQGAEPRQTAAINHQSQQVLQGDMHEGRTGQMEEDQQQGGQQRPLPLPPPLQEQQQDEPQRELPSPPAKPPVRTGSYPDGWEVLDEQGEVVAPQQQHGGGSESDRGTVRVATVPSGGFRR
ncbi:hypothetical protein Vretimale_8221 [Volvox reticuliferus]|nr:hypothetical protein Vretimale_8221 [Volvox reticuliferus]